jgi:hypothetical protein
VGWHQRCGVERRFVAIGDAPTPVKQTKKGNSSLGGHEDVVDEVVPRSGAAHARDVPRVDGLDLGSGEQEHHLNDGAISLVREAASDDLGGVHDSGAPRPASLDLVAAVDRGGGAGGKVERGGSEHVIGVAVRLVLHRFGILGKPKRVLDVEAYEPPHRWVGFRQDEHQFEEGVDVDLVAAVALRTIMEKSPLSRAASITSSSGRRAISASLAFSRSRGARSRAAWMKPSGVTATPRRPLRNYLFACLPNMMPATRRI